MSKRKGWIGVDLDGTLAHYDHWRGADHIGEPVPPMLARVKAWIDAGDDVQIFTARVFGAGMVVPPVPLIEVYGSVEAMRCTGMQIDDAIVAAHYIQVWCQKHVGRVLPVTCMKDYGMIQLWDDRAVQVVPNTGVRVDGCG